MGSCTLRDGTVISDYGRPYIVAEVNSSHNGNINLAKSMIEKAAEIGCDCVKFQSWSAESLYSETYYEANPISKRIVKKMSLSPEQLKEAALYCRDCHISFASTPYSEEEVDFLINECKAPFIKIASMEINHYRFLRYIGETKMPVVLSTGMSDMDEVIKAVDVLQEAGADQIVLLHCVSIYPTVIETVNLRNMIGLRKQFPAFPVGFSDHTEGDEASIAAVTLGAGLIEKHFTLDKSKVGMDNGMAMEPDHLKALVDKCRNIHLVLGEEERRVSDAELEQRKKMRRSIIAAKDIPAGSEITTDDIYAKRPGTGISPDREADVIGKKALKDLKKGYLIMQEDID